MTPDFFTTETQRIRIYGILCALQRSGWLNIGSGSAGLGYKEKR